MIKLFLQNETSMIKIFIKHQRFDYFNHAVPSDIWKFKR